jgi:hypothetical protein
MDRPSGGRAVVRLLVVAVRSYFVKAPKKESMRCEHGLRRLKIFIKVTDVGLIHTCHAAVLPFSDSAVSLVKVRVVVGNIRTASPAD